MKQETNLLQEKQEINHLGLEKIREYFELDNETLIKIEPHALKHLHNMARLGMQFEKEMNLSRRASELNFIRVGKMITENKKELKEYIKRTLPQYK